jgi:CRISPR-associated protein Cas2
MFVAVILELASEDNRVRVRDLIRQYGFKSVMGNLHESHTIAEDRLNRLKKDIDRVTDSYDRVRFYQYPYEDTLIVTDLKGKKWRRQKIVF